MPDLDDWPDDDRPDDELPLVAGEVIGWRAWVVLHGRGYREPRLRSLYFDVVWPTDRWLVAGEADRDVYVTPHGICAGRDREHLAGLHRYSDPTRARYVEGGEEAPWAAIGQVGLAGLIVPGERGYRAERARVVSIVLPYAAWELLEDLARAYRVPVTLGNVLVADQEGPPRGHRP